MISVDEALAKAHRREWTAVLAATVRLTRDLDLAEECAQSAFAAAVDTWARDGVPANPGAWLTTASRHDAVDALRRAATLRSKLHLLVEPTASPADSQHADVDPDDPLRLVLLCCHPALSAEAQIALTLRLVCDVPTADIAAVFLVSETTMAARITRAKHKIRAAQIPFRMPEPAELPDRLDAASATIHLLFTAGYGPPSGTTLSNDLVADRAIDLARDLHSRASSHREISGLLGLLLATHARRSTRTDARGNLILLEDQDRSRWDHDAIAEAHDLIVAALAGGRPGRFALQAAIAGLHAAAPTYTETDWTQILELYDQLLLVWPTPVVALNRAVAVAMAHGPEAGLADLAVLMQDAQLAGYRYLAAVEADLLRRLGRVTLARAAYERAIGLTDNEVERSFLVRRLAALDAGPTR